MDFDAAIQPNLVNVRNLAVQDDQSSMRMSIQRHEGLLQGAFAGTLVGNSLNRIGRATQSSETRVAGNLTYRVPLKRPREFSANGELHVSRLDTIRSAAAPFHITVRSADIKASGRTLAVGASFSLQDTNFDVNGTIRSTDRRYAVDIDVKSDSVDMDRLLGARDQPGAPDKEKRQMSWDFPVEGKVRLAIQSLRYDPYRVEPMNATMDIAPGRINFAVKEARLCGIGIAGGGRAEPANLSIDVVLRARGIDPSPTLLCLTRDRTSLTGSLDADAHLTASGGMGSSGDACRARFTWSLARAVSIA